MPRPTKSGLMFRDSAIGNSVKLTVLLLGYLRLATPLVCSNLRVGILFLRVRYVLPTGQSPSVANCVVH